MDTVPGKLTFRKKHSKLENNIGEFHQDYYLPSIERLVYHQLYYKILGKKNVAAIRQHAFQSSPGSIYTCLTMLKSLVLIPMDNCEVNNFPTIEVYQWKVAV